MAKPAIKGGRVGSIKKLRASLKRSASAFIRNVPADDGLTVRFLTEPPEWVEYFEWFIPSMEPKFFPDFEGLPDDVKAESESGKPAKRYLASVVDVSDNSVIPLKMPKTLVDSLMRKYEKYKTIMDRDYELIREGQGMDTKYDAIPEAPQRRNMAKFTALDLMSILSDAIPSELLPDGDDDDDLADDDEPIRRSTARRRPRPVEDDDDEEPKTPRRIVRKRATGATPRKTTKAAPRGLRRK